MGKDEKAMKKIILDSLVFVVVTPSFFLMLLLSLLGIGIGLEIVHNFLLNVFDCHNASCKGTIVLFSLFGYMGLFFGIVFGIVNFLEGMKELKREKIIETIFKAEE